MNTYFSEPESKSMIIAHGEEFIRLFYKDIVPVIFYHLCGAVLTCIALRCMYRGSSDSI